MSSRHTPTISVIRQPVEEIGQKAMAALIERLKHSGEEVAQEREGFTPHYRVLEESGPDHDKLFTVGVYVGDRLCGKGQGSSKQTAQQQAATNALTNY